MKYDAVAHVPAVIYVVPRRDLTDAGRKLINLLPLEEQLRAEEELMDDPKYAILTYSWRILVSGHNWAPSGDGHQTEAAALERAHQALHEYGGYEHECADQA